MPDTSSIVVSEIGADHFGVGEHGVGRALRDLAAGIHDDAAVAQRADRVHDMLDQQDGHAFAAQRAHQRDTLLQLGRIEAGEPFVE